MKKRALSMLLAFALCFTVFSGVGSAAKLTVSRGLDSMGGVLDSLAANDDPRLPVIKDIENSEVLKALESEDPLANADVQAFADLVLPEDLFLDSETVYPYFVLRYLQAGMDEEYNAETYPIVAGVLEDMAELDGLYNTSAPGISVRDALDMFTPYQSKLTTIVQNAVANGGEEFTTLGYAAANGADYKFDSAGAKAEGVITYARDCVIKTFAAVTPLLSAISSEEVNKAYYDFMGPEALDLQKATDRQKKDLALTLSKELMDQLTTGTIPAVREFITANKTDFMNEVITKGNVQALFNSDKTNAVDAAHDTATQAADFVLDRSADSDKITKVLDLIAARYGVDDAVAFVRKAEGAFIDLVKAIDSERIYQADSYQVVWMDIALGRALDIYDRAYGMNHNTALMRTVPSGQAMYFHVYHRALHNRFGIDRKIEVDADNLYLVSQTEGVEANKSAGGMWTLVYDKTTVPTNTATFKVYRGGDALDEAAQPEIYRYLKDITVYIEKAGEPVPGESSITVKVDPAEVHNGDDITISGTVNDDWKIAHGDVLNVVITDSEGTEVKSYESVNVAEYAAGITYTVDGLTEDADYTVWAGVNGEAGKDNATATFHVLKETEPPIPGTPVITLDAYTQQYEVGATLPVSGTAKDLSGTTVKIDITDAAGEKKIDTKTVTVADEKFSDTVVLEGFVPGVYTVTASDPDGEAEAVSQNFTVIEKTHEIIPVVNIDTISGTYAVGDTANVSGTTENVEKVKITVYSSTDEVVAESEEIAVVNDAYEYNLAITEAFAVGIYKVVAKDVASDAQADTTLEVVPAGEQKNVSITNKDVLGRAEGYKRGEPVEVTGKVSGLDSVIASITDPDNKAEYYTTITEFDAEGKFSFTINVPLDAKLGTYTVIVGQDGATDTATYKVVAENVPVDPEITNVVGEKTRNTTKYVARKKPVEDVLKAFANKSTPLKAIFAIKNEDGSLKNVEYNYLDNPDFFDVSDITANYDPEEKLDQRFEVTYDMNKIGVLEGASVPSGWNAVDGKIQVTVTRNSGGGGGGGGTGGTSRSLTLDRSVLKGEYAPGEGILIKGTSKGYTTIRVTVTAPDGSTQTFEITPEEFANGYYLRLLEPGVYQIDVEGEKFTVVITGLTSDIFDKDNHFNYIVGYEDGTVRPEANISREEVAAVLYRLLKDEYRTAFHRDTTNAYSDIETDRWSMPSIATLNNIGIIRGYEDNTFRPGRAITRAEFAALVSRLASVKPSAPVVLNNYTDVAGHWAESDIYVVTAEGWFMGDTNGSFRPDDKITRAEAVTVINRILDRDQVTTASFANAKIAEFSDLAEDAWYYANMVEAINAHAYTKNSTSGEETWTSVSDDTDWAK